MISLNSRQRMRCAGGVPLMAGVLDIFSQAMSVFVFRTSDEHVGDDSRSLEAWHDKMLT